MNKLAPGVLCNLVANGQPVELSTNVSGCEPDLATCSTAGDRTGRRLTRIDATSLASLETVEKAVACLRLSSPEVEGVYPKDAESHFQEIHQDLNQFLSDVQVHRWSGYEGPWIENYWIRFSQRWFQRSQGVRLKDLFGPFIPIFVPWVDLVLQGGYPYGMMEKLRRWMRRTVLYITVSQHDLGIFSSVEPPLLQADMPNLLVLSSGGNGHVPLPLLKQLEQPLAPRPRRYFVSFAGRARTHKLRDEMKSIVEEWGRRTGKEVFVSERMEDWLPLLQNSSLALVPRGWGRSSFRCSEMLQMGRVPIYVWDDIPWTFYRELWDKELIGFSANILALDKVLDRIAELSLDKLQMMEKLILSMRSSHFTYDGVMDQILRFMTGQKGGSDLRCTAYPGHPLQVERDGVKSEKDARCSLALGFHARLAYVTYVESTCQNSLRRAETD